MIRLPDVTLTGSPFTVTIPGQPGRWASMVLENESGYQLTVNYAGTQLIIPAWTADLVQLQLGYTNLDFGVNRNLPTGFDPDKTLSINLFEKSEPQPVGYPIALTRATGSGTGMTKIGAVSVVGGVFTPSVGPSGQSGPWKVPTNAVAVMVTWTNQSRFNYVSSINGFRANGTDIVQLAGPYTYDTSQNNNQVVFAAINPVDTPNAQFWIGPQSADDTYNFYALTAPLVYPVVNADDGLWVVGADQLRSSNTGIGVQGVSSVGSVLPTPVLVTNQQNYTVGNQTSVAASVTSVLILRDSSGSPRYGRLGATVYNQTVTGNLYLLVATGTAASLTNFTVMLVPGAYYELPGPSVFPEAVWGIWDVADGTAYVTEYY